MMKIQIICLIFLIILFLGCTEQTDNHTDQDGSTEQEDQVNETINHPPGASFTYTNDEYTVMFYDTSTDADNDTLTYIWNFGDGFNSINQNPVHTYDCSETNVFDVTLTVNDGKSEDTYTEHILFGSHLEILEYSQNWVRQEPDETKGLYEPFWIGYISMTIENTGNLPAKISHASMWTKDQKYYSEIYFNFTYTYDELVEGGNENGFGSEIWLTFISNNTLTLNPDKSITLTSNPDLTYVAWGSGSYPVNIWLLEKIRGEDRISTLYETTIELF